MRPAAATDLPVAATVAARTFDDPLVERLRRGDPEAFSELVWTHQARLLAVARRFLGNEADAEDAVQDAMLRAFREIHRFEGRSSLATWLHRIVINSALMARRSRGRRRERSQTDLHEVAIADHAIGHCPAATMIAHEEQTATRHRVRRHVAALPASFRRVVELRHFHHRTTAATANIMGVSPGAAKACLHRAVSRLEQSVRADAALLAG